MERRMISKETVKSFDDMETVIEIKDKLIKFTTHHINIFGILESVETNQKSLIFNFRYVPSVSLKQLCQLQLSQKQVKYLADKVWMFILSMKNNGFEEYISTLMRRNELSLLLDKIEYNLDGMLSIGQISLILQEKAPNSRMTSQVEKQLLSDIFNYLSEESLLSEDEDRFGMNIKQEIDFYDLYSVFRRKKYVCQQIK